MSRNISRFKQPGMWYEFQRRVKERLGLDVIATSVDRDYKEQAALYAQGREPLEVVNNLRRLAGLAPITSQENQRQVTWTMNSRHIVNIDDGTPDNDLSRAVDFGIIYMGRYIGDAKADVTNDNQADYLQCAMIAEEVGFRSGRHFTKPDMPHIEIA